MVNLKKYSVVFNYFVLLLTFTGILSCGNNQFYLTKIEGKKIAITNTSSETAAIENYIKPYRESIDKDLNTLLAFAPITLDKSGEWQSTIGDLLADITLERGNRIFQLRHQRTIDICLLNSGGIRSIIPKGNVYTKTAFEVMPFENTSIIVDLKGEQIIEMVDYIIAEKKPHPLAGLTFSIDKNSIASSILVNGKPVVNEQLYAVITSDYLANGGDKMNFFKKGIARYDLDYKLRNVLIDYLKDTDTIPISTNIRIKKLN